VKDLSQRIRVHQGDLTQLAVDALVNAANESLLGGGGVDGAIHRAAGPELLEGCRALGGCPTGEAKLTRGHRLRAKYVIHTVGPVWRGGAHGEPALLASCYRASLELAAQMRCETVAFPGLSTGVYGYPIEAAARIAVATVSAWLREHELPREVTFCTFNAASTAAIDAALRELGRRP
jgi:O-acetyl-ADP-ribose deacetylase (regulator of RNase III)